MRRARMNELSSVGRVPLGATVMFVAGLVICFVKATSGCRGLYWMCILLHISPSCASKFFQTFIWKMAETRKPDKLYATHPKNYGKGSRPCRVTGRNGGMGLIRKYGINMKRQVFRERAIDMGWVKYN